MVNYFFYLYYRIKYKHIINIITYIYVESNSLFIIIVGTE